MKLTKKDISLIPSSYDVVGDIIIFAEFPKMSLSKEKAIGQYILDTQNNIKVVCKKTKKYSGKFRLPTLRIIAGERRKETLYRENGIRLKLHVEKVYFSPRTATERQRISSLVKSGEDVLVMFSGSGVFCVNIAKNSSCKSVVGVEINPAAHKYALENLVLNKITNVGLLKGDVRNVLPKVSKKFDRILLPLPKNAMEFFALALKSLKKKGIVHVYEFVNINEVDVLKGKIISICKKSKRKCKIISVTKCGQYGPGIYRVCVDVRVF